MTGAAFPTLVRGRTWWVLPVLIAVLSAAVVQWATAPYLVGVFHDDGIYALLARSIAVGQGFHYSHLPGAPAATHYPPLYPLVLSAAWRFAPAFPGNVPFLLAPNALFVGTAVAGSWWYLTTCLGWPAARAAAASMVASLATPTLALAGALLSESLFLALLWLTLIACERTVDGQGKDRLACAGMLLGALMLTRTHGVALLAATITLLVVRARWRDAVVLATLAECVLLPWQIWSRFSVPHIPAPLEGSYGSYIGWFAQGLRGHDGAAFALATAHANAIECWLLICDRVAWGGPAAATSTSAILFLLLAATGLWALRRRGVVLACFLAWYGGILLVWPYAPWRFLWCIWPLLAVLAFEGTLMLRRAGRAWGALGSIAFAVLMLSALLTESRAYASRGWRNPARRSAAQILPVIEWAKARTTVRDTLLSEGEQVVALYANRIAAPPVSFTAREYLATGSDADYAARLQAMLHVVPADYVVLLGAPTKPMIDALSALHPPLTLVAHLASGSVYRAMR